MKKLIIVTLLVMLLFLMGCEGYQITGLVVLKQNYLEIETEFSGNFKYDNALYDWEFIDIGDGLIRVRELATNHLTTFTVRNILYFKNY